jgi:hypothetical protein
VKSVISAQKTANQHQRATFNQKITSSIPPKQFQQLRVNKNHPTGSLKKKNSRLRKHVSGAHNPESKQLGSSRNGIQQQLNSPCASYFSLILASQQCATLQRGEGSPFFNVASIYCHKLTTSMTS